MKIIIGLAALAALLTGCGAPEIGPRDENAHFFQDLGDGTQVECWFITQGNSQSATGGPTCDWVAYHQRYDAK